MIEKIGGLLAALIQKINEEVDFSHNNRCHLINNYNI